MPNDLSDHRIPSIRSANFIEGINVVRVLSTGQKIIVIKTG